MNTGLKWSIYLNGRCVAQVRVPICFCLFVVDFLNNNFHHRLYCNHSIHTKCPVYLAGVISQNEVFLFKFTAN